MMGWYNDGMGAGGWFVMLTAMSIFWGLVILAGVLIFRGGSSGGGYGNQGGSRGPSAIDILDERFARGELDQEEYAARKAALRGSAH